MNLRIMQVAVDMAKDLVEWDKEYLLNRDTLRNILNKKQR